MEGGKKNVPFIWGSPLHFLSKLDQVEWNPYDIVEIFEEDIKTKLDSPKNTVQNGHNTFQKFGYNDMLDIDSSEDENFTLNHDSTLSTNGDDRSVWSASHNMLNHLPKANRARSFLIDNDVRSSIQQDSTQIDNYQNAMKSFTLNNDSAYAVEKDLKKGEESFPKSYEAENEATAKLLPLSEFDVNESNYKLNDSYRRTDQEKRIEQNHVTSEESEVSEDALDLSWKIILDTECRVQDRRDSSDKEPSTCDAESVISEALEREVGLTIEKPDISQTHTHIEDDGYTNNSSDLEERIKDLRCNTYSTSSEDEQQVKFNLNSYNDIESQIMRQLSFENKPTEEQRNCSRNAFDCPSSTTKTVPVTRNTAKVFANIGPEESTSSDDEIEEVDNRLTFSNFHSNVKSTESRTFRQSFKSQRTNEQLNKVMRKTLDTSSSFLSDLGRFSSRQSDDSKEEMCGSNFNSNLSSMNVYNQDSEETQQNIFTASKTQEEIVQFGQPNACQKKKTWSKSQSNERLMDRATPEIKDQFMIKHFTTSENRKRRRNRYKIHPLEGRLSKSMSSLPQTEDEIKELYTKKCQETERKYTRDKMNFREDKPFRKSPQYSYPEDVSPLSFEEQASQPWYPGKSLNQSGSYPDELTSYDNDNLWNTSGPPDSDFAFQNQRDAVEVADTVYDRETGNHDHYHHHHIPSCPGHKCNRRMVHTCIHLTQSDTRFQKMPDDEQTVTTDNHASGGFGCYRSQIKETLKLLTQYMDGCGYEVKNVSSDGNCLFAAVVDQLRINGDFSFTTESLRMKSVELLKNRPLIDGETHMSAFLSNETWDEYLRRMILDGEWGDDIILRGISELTGRKIVVYSSYNSKTILTPTSVYEKEELYIGHIRDLLHFVSLRPHYWEIYWPARAKTKRMRLTIEELETTSAIYLSCKEVYQEKIDKVAEYILQGDVNNAKKSLREIEQFLNKSREKERFFPLQTETKETMKALVENMRSIDFKSGFSMLHLSFLIKLLIKENFVRVSIQDPNSYMSLFDTDEHTYSIGENELGLDTSLIDLTNAMQHFELIQKKVTDKKPISYTFVKMPPNETYAVKGEENIQVVRPSTRLLKIECIDTYPGYTRLMTRDPAQWTHCVEVVTKKCYLHTLNLKRIPDSPVSDVSMKQFEGLICESWPEAALLWKQRKTESGWPSPRTIQEAVNKGCILIKRSHEFSERPNIEWRFVFHDAEKVLIQSFNGSMTYAFNVFKILIDFQTRKVGIRIKPYILLTVMFYCCEEIPLEAWSSNTGGCVMYLIAWLLQHLRDHDIPNYFIEENNMIEHVDGKEVKNLEYYLETLRWFPFASVYFLLESHSFLNLNMMDRIESSMDEYKLTNDAQRTIDSVFVPICFTMALQSIKYNAIPFFKSAIDLLDLAFELTSSISSERSNSSFEEFIRSFLSSVAKSQKTIFCQLVDKERKTNLCKHLLQGKVALPLGKILGPEYQGPWKNVLVDATVEEKWNSIYKLTAHLTFGEDVNECIEILRCSISVLHQELKNGDAEPNETSGEEARKLLQQAQHKQVYIILSCLVTFYKYLAVCYENSGTIELFQEHIHDYEDIVTRIDSFRHYENLAKLYRQLGNREKANEFESMTKEMRPEDQCRSMFMLVI